MKRHQHFLSHNKSVPLPQNIAWVDTETDQRKIGPLEVKHVLRFGWSCFQRTHDRGAWSAPEWRRFTRPRPFWDWLVEHTRPKTRLYVFAHNWGFDAPVLDAFTILPELGWKLTAVVIESPPVILSWRKDTRVIEMIDTLNYWRVSLKSLGDSIGAPKLPMPGRRAKRKTWDRYCRNDVEVLRVAIHNWLGFIKEYDLGGFARTLAGQSMRAFRHRFMDHPILIDNHTHATALARESYHGGRTECFRLGKVRGPVHVLDVNSMYPAVMRDRSFPTVLRLHTRTANETELRRWLSSKAVVARVDLATDSPQYAHVQGDKLIFPVGRFRTVLTTPDLIAALDQRHVRGIHEVAVYDRAPIFARFVEEIYQLRLAAGDRGDDVARFMLKILMNSLYGKFAQRGNVWNTERDADTLEVRTWVEFDFETGEVRRLRQFAGIIQGLTREPEAFSSHPAIASHVTAYARRRLWDLFTLAGRSNVYYCDTDSLYVNPEGFARLAPEIVDSRLGALKDEATHPWVVFHGPKDYETPERKKTKGVRASAVWTGPNRVHQEQWSSLVGLLNKSQLEAPTTKQVQKVLSRVYGKGTVGTGGIVSPFVLSEEG